MSKKAFDKIAEGLTEALAIAKGEKKPAKLHIPPELDVCAIRAKIGLSQDDLATALALLSIRSEIGNRAAPARSANPRISHDHQSRSEGCP